MSKHVALVPQLLFFFFFNDTATTEIYTLSLHDALPISALLHPLLRRCTSAAASGTTRRSGPLPGSLVHCRCCSGDRKSTRLNSSHANISYAVFCLKKKKQADSSCIQIYAAHCIYYKDRT